MAFELPKLSYAYADLEPYIDAKTMEIHHTKHHQAYITNVNVALEGTPFLEKTVESLLRDINSVPDAIKQVVKNNGGGHANHSLFWTILNPGAPQQPTPKISQAILENFGSWDVFKEKFETAAKTRFGSGWAWLTVCQNGSLEVSSTANQDSPLMEGKTPILGLDVWEHAYYLHYQNRRPDYVAAFWHVVNWEEVERRLLAKK